MKHLKPLFLALLLISCGGDSVQKDLLNYINTALPKISTLEHDAVVAYEGVAGANYKGDSTMYYTIKQTVIPKYEEFSAGLAAIHPATEEITLMHGEYVKAAVDQLEAFKLICLAIEKQDAEVIKQANSDLDKARSLIDVWKTDLTEKCKKHGVVLEK